MEKDIFEDIINSLEDCNYISDLRTMLGSQGYLRLLQVIENLRYDDYTLNQWCEISEYILMKNVEFKSNQEAYEYLINELKKSISLLQ
ncbi:MAG: hypothetical protein RR543_05910 [Erysipelotrichales bacterium]